MPQLSFKTSIPDEVLAYPATSKYITILDLLYTHKKSLIDKAHRVYNPVLLTDLNYLRKNVNEQGYPQVPFEFPKVILDNMYLCAEDVMALMGSKIGLDYLLRVLTCGVPTIDDTNFYPKEDYIILSDLVNGFLPAESDFMDDVFYLFDGVLNFAGGVMTISIATPFWDFQPLKDYINNNIRRFVGFSDAFNIITIDFVPGPFVQNPYMFNYFSKVI